MGENIVKRHFLAQTWIGSSDNDNLAVELHGALADAHRQLLEQVDQGHDGDELSQDTGAQEPEDRVQEEALVRFVESHDDASQLWSPGAGPTKICKLVERIC